MELENIVDFIYNSDKLDGLSHSKSSIEKTITNRFNYSPNNPSYIDSHYDAILYVIDRISNKIQPTHADLVTLYKILSKSSLSKDQLKQLKLYNSKVLVAFKAMIDQPRKEKAAYCNYAHDMIHHLLLFDEYTGRVSRLFANMLRLMLKLKWRMVDYKKKSSYYKSIGMSEHLFKKHFEI